VIWTIVIAVLGILGTALFVLGLRRLWQRRAITGTVQGLTGLVFIAAAALAYALMLNLHTYRRFTQETAVAEIAFRQTAPQTFKAILTPASGESTRSLELAGDEWQLDARVLKWRGWATLLGLDPMYRLERLGGRYQDIEKEHTAARTVHALGPPDSGLDLWTLARAWHAWLPMVDAVYGNAAYLPMTDGARYEVRLSITGLVARPLNAPAEEAVRAWR
jgi:hypothetical protein